MKIGFIENEMRLVSSGAVNLMMEWVNLLRLRHTVDLIQWDKDISKTVLDEKYSCTMIRDAAENRDVLEEYDMLIVNHIGEPAESFYTVLSECKKPVTIFVYHDRTVARDIFTDPVFMKYINACDYVMTYQPKLLIEKLGVSEEKVRPIDLITFYKDPKEYSDTSELPKKKRSIEMLYCNRTNNFKGARYFMEWCKYLKEKEHILPRVMKGFHPDYPHKDLPKYDTMSYKTWIEGDKQNPDSLEFDKFDFCTEDYSTHERCKELLYNSRFVWVAQDFSEFPKDKFKDLKEYMSYLNYDPDGMTIEAMLCGCIPILHIANKQSEIYEEIGKYCVFFDPDKGYDDLYEQIQKLHVTNASRNLSKSIRELYSTKLIFLNGLEMTITPQAVFDFYKGMIQEVAARENL